MKTLAFLKTHKITKNVIEEYLKIKRTDIDAVILYDNKMHTYIPDKDSVITELNVYGETIPVIMTDLDMYEKFNLPGFYDDRNNNDYFRFIWYNSDYPIYIVRQLFPEYDYYWQIEYDVYCNGESYQEFFDTYKDSKADLLAVKLGDADKTWWAVQKNEWIYGKDYNYNCCILPVLRISAEGADFLYKRRIAQGKLYESITPDENVRWMFCEVFVATEIGNHPTLLAEPILEQNIKTEPLINLEEDKLYLNPDNKLYHPVKGLDEEKEDSSFFMLFEDSD